MNTGSLLFRCSAAFTQVTLLLLCSPGVHLHTCKAEGIAKPVRPNIVFVLADDLGYGDLGCYGQENFTTENIDRLAAQGMRFTEHYAGSTVCAPSRACLLTGMHTGHVYQRANGPLQFREDPLDTTLATILQNAGYRTAMIGKSGLSCNSDDGALPNRKGFDYFFGFTSHELAHRYYPEFLWRNGQKVAYPNNHGMEGQLYSGDLFLDETLQYLESQKSADTPFFLHVALQQPHADLSVPQEWKEPFFGRFQEAPSIGIGYRSEDHPMSTYAGMVTHLDNSIGKIVNKLAELGLAENTLLLFSSDNGAMSEGGWDRNWFASSGALRGGKRDLYEGGIRVPLIAYWPGTIKPGLQTDHVSAFWDFLPTVCELAGIPAPEDTDGISYAPTLLNTTEQAEHDFLYWEFHEQGGKQAVRAGKWKGVRKDVIHTANAPLELYDLEQDPGESQDIAAKHTAVANRLVLIMNDARTPSELVEFAEERTLPNSN